MTDTRITPPWDSPICTVVADLQDAGRDVYIAGFSRDLRHVLIVDVDNGTVSVAAVATVNGLGRWECSKAHHTAHRDIYTDRFPHL